MNTESRKYSGRVINSEDIEIIKETIAMYPKLSQKELASTICENIGWIMPSGQPKRTQCVQFLRMLEEEGEIQLPALQTRGTNGNRSIGKSIANAKDEEWMETTPVETCGQITLEIANAGKELKRWRTYVSCFHQLGDSNTYGNRICYILRSQGRELACLQFSAASWALAPREAWIGWTAKDKKARLHLVVNNSRMLILPWVHVKNLASRILSLAAKQVKKDWLREFCYEPVLLETFVDTQYKGTIYKAANWSYLGETQGRGRNDRYNQRALTRKAIYAYPLCRDFRAILRGEKPCREVNPDER